MDGNMNKLILRLHPTRGSPTNVCLIAIAWYNSSIRSDMHSVFGVSPRKRPSGKKWQVLYNLGPEGKTHGLREWPSGGGPLVGSCTFAKIWIPAQIRGSDPLVGRKQLVSHSDPTSE